jgi:hypothetical protein
VLKTATVAVHNQSVSVKFITLLTDRIIHGIPRCSQLKLPAETNARNEYLRVVKKEKPERHQPGRLSMMMIDDDAYRSA